MTPEKKPNQKQPDDNTQWQVRLLPFMIGLLLVLVFFFFTATCVQLFRLNVYVQSAPGLPSPELMAGSNTTPFLEKQWNSLIMLESHILQQRYHQARALLMARIWVRYLGFVTGMILSMIGAIFILGKLREPSSSLTLGGHTGEKASPHNLKVELITQSPGIFLVTMGTILMLVTVLVHQDIVVTDKAVYTAVSVSGGSEKKPSPPPQLTPQANNDQATGKTFLETLHKAKSQFHIDQQETP